MIELNRLFLDTNIYIIGTQLTSLKKLFLF